LHSNLARTHWLKQTNFSLKRNAQVFLQKCIDTATSWV